MRKSALVLAMVLLATLFTTGCGGGKPAAPEGGAGAEAVEITVWGWDVAYTQLSDCAEAYKAEHPEVTFVLEEMGTDQIYNKLMTHLATGVGLPDVVAIEGEQMARFGNNFPDMFVKLDDIVEADKFLPIKMGEVTVEGNVLAFPWDAAPMAMFYRRDLFEQAGVEAESIVTWDDYIEAGKKVVEATGVQMMPLAESTRDTFFRTLLMQQGEFYFDKDNNTVLNSEEAITAMTMVKKIFDAGITQNYTGWDEYVSAIINGKVATIPEAVWMIGTLQEESIDESVKWGVIPMPKFTADGSSGASNGGSVLAIPSTTQHEDVVKDFVSFALTDEEQLVNGFKNYGLYPSYTPVYENAIFSEGVELFDGQKVYELFNQYAVEMPEVNYTENFSEVSDAMKNVVAKVLLENADIPTAMDGIQEEMKAKLGR